MFGPVPRKHGHALSKKTRRAALISVLSTRVAEDALVVVDSLELEEFKTKAIAEMLASLGIAGKSALIVIAEENEKVEKSAANVARVGCIRVAGLNVYDVLRHQKLILTKDAVAALEARLSPAPRGDK